MAITELKFYESGNQTNSDRGSVTPNWAGNYNISNWWSSATNVSFFFSKTASGETYIQYGQNTSIWASAKFFGENIEILSETQNSDNSLTVQVRVTPTFFVSRRTNFAGGGVSVQWTLQLNGNTVYSFSGSTADEFTNGSGTAQTFTVTIPPQGEATGTVFDVTVVYPNGEYPTARFQVGFALYNPLPDTYVPMAIRKSGAWRDLNSNNGRIRRRNANGSITDVSQEDASTSRGANVGKNRIRKSNVNRQLPPMSGGTPQ